MGLYYSVIIFAAIIGLYGLVWIYLLTGAGIAQSRARKQFMAAWENDDYTVHDYGSYREESLEVRFPVHGHGERAFSMDYDGNIKSDFYWTNIKNQNLTPSRKTRALVEEIAKQIATMHKLESNMDGDKEGNSGGW